jgi:6-pyruvoyltetrahydropterin/6-carboxytetrahydropterin synthase
MLKRSRMRTRLERTFRFEAAHFLPKVVPGHKCARMHGHSYQIDVIVEGELDAELGWLLDFGDLDAKVMPLIDRLDHHVLNEIEGLSNPTSELLAAWMWERLKPGLPQLVELSVAETPSSRCVYRGG